MTLVFFYDIIELYFVIFTKRIIINKKGKIMDNEIYENTKDIISDYDRVCSAISKYNNNPKVFANNVNILIGKMLSENEMYETSRFEDSKESRKHEIRYLTCASLIIKLFDCNFKLTLETEGMLDLKQSVLNLLFNGNKEIIDNIPNMLLVKATKDLENNKDISI